MRPDANLFAQLLTIVALIGATIEYCELMRRREVGRRQAALRSEAAFAGLRGLVRVLAAD